MRDLDEDKKLKGRSNENRLSNGGCLGFGLDCGLYQVSGIRYEVSSIRERKGKGEGRGSCGNQVDGIEIVGIMIMPSGMR